MKPTDLRNATWREVLTHISEDMVRVHLAWSAHGPGTTRQIAQRAGLSLLTLRPRTTDLHKLGLVALQGGHKSEGIYRYVDRCEAELAGHWRSRAAAPHASRLAPHAADQPTGFLTVEQAIQSLTPAERAALGARLMGQYGHGAKRREAALGAHQLSLLTA